MRVAIVIPGNIDKKKSQSFSHLLRSPPPLGVAYIAAQIRQAGHEVIVIDQFSERLSSGTVVSRIMAHQTNVVAFSCLTPNVSMISLLAQQIRKKNSQVKILAGNAHASEYPESLFREVPGLDAIVHDEGDITAVELISAWEENRDLRSVQGVSFVIENRVISTARRAPVADLDALVRPAWDLFPLELYRNSTQNLIRGDMQMLAVHLSRGCPWRCTFCAQNFYRADVRRRDPDKVAEEVAWFVDTFGVNHFGFTDPIFPLTDDDAFGFAAGLEKRGLAGKVKFLLTTRTDLVKKQAFAALRQVGLHVAYLGIETASDSTLKQIQKNVVSSEAAQAVATLREVGVLSYGLFVLGLPGETKESMQKTLNFALQLDCDIATFSRMTPYAGAPLDRQLRLLDKPEFRDTHDNWHAGAQTQLPLTDLTIADVARFQRWAMFRYYLRPSVFIKLLRFVSLARLVLGGFSLIAAGVASYFFIDRRAIGTR